MSIEREINNKIKDHLTEYCDHRHCSKRSIIMTKEVQEVKTLISITRMDLEQKLEKHKKKQQMLLYKGICCVLLAQAFFVALNYWIF